MCHEKHDTCAYNALTREDCYASALEILEQRFADSYYYKPSPDSYGCTEPELSKEEIAKLPDGSIKQAALQQWKRVERNKSAYEYDLVGYQEIECAIENQDGRLALSILIDRSDYEYERISLEKIHGGIPK
jgi:hypothetical protein